MSSYACGPIWATVPYEIIFSGPLAQLIELTWVPVEWNEIVENAWRNSWHENFQCFCPPSGRPTLKPNSQKSPPDRSKINQKNVRILMHLSWFFNPTWGRFWTWDCWTKFEARLSKMLNNIRKSRPWICYQWFVVKEITGVAPVIVVVEVLV